MPKENTHLFFAHTLLPQIAEQDIRLLIGHNLPAFCLGSVTPDAFFYSRNDTVTYVSDLMHGEDGRLTNEVIFKLLDTARADNHEDVLIFALGYVSHCALDMIFHPVIGYLTGNCYDDNQQKRVKAMYKHRLIETFIDTRMNGYYFVDQIVDIQKFAHFAGLEVISKEFGVSFPDILRAFTRQKISNKRFRSPGWFRLASTLYRLGLGKMDLVLPLFYPMVEKEAAFSQNIISDGGYDSRDAFLKTLDDLTQKAYALGGEMIRAAYAYHQGAIDRAECAKVITGVNLATGRIDILPRRMRYSEES